MIPLVDVKAQYAPLIPALKERIGEVVESGRFILGPNVAAFEEETAAYLGVPATIGVANGTDALVLALDAMGIGEGDEVICPSFTFYATPEAIVRRGATPVFADIDAATLNLDPEDVERRITPRTKAIMPVHLFGRPAPLRELAGLDVQIVEDAAQAFGAEGVAQTGVTSTFSFFPTKNLFGLGDGGLVAATDEEVADRVRLLRFHGSRDKVDFELVGYNSRLDEIQAAALRALPAAPLGLESGSPGGGRALRRARSGGDLRAARRRRPARLPHVRRPQPGARPDRRGADRGRDLLRVVLRHADAPPAGAALPGGRGRLAARDRAGRAREPRAADVGRDRPEDQERVVSVDPRRRLAPGARRDLAADHAAPLLATRRRRRPRRRGVVPRLPPPLRPEDPALLPHDVHADDLDRPADPARRSSSSSASTTAGGATSRRATCGAQRAA